jgi:DNA-directed RNA polymerase beta' subunit
MKLELLDVNRFIQVNAIQECTSPRLFSNKGLFDPGGVLSNEIFGISKSDRLGTYAYIDLKNPFIHPHVYEAFLKRLFKGVIYIVSGTRRYSIKDSMLVEDNENGWTGLHQLYDHWDEIDWSKSASSNERSLTFLKNTNKDDIFITRLVICPPFYRDVFVSTDDDNSDRINQLNKHYTAIIRMVGLLSEGGIFARRQYTTQARIQETLGEVYNYFKDRIRGKYGMIKRYLMGKNITYGTRSVISAPTYNNERLEDNMVDINHAALPIAQCCAAFYPFVESWVKNFFTREIINDANLVRYYDPEKQKEVSISLKNPELQFSEKVVKKMILDYVRNPDNRFKPIIVEAISPNAKKDAIKVMMVLKGKQIIGNNHSDLKRPLTITDILYLACVDVCEKRHIMISRYPVGTDKGLFFNKVRVQSTKTHDHVIFNGVEYRFYPHIDMNTDPDKVGVQFIDTLVYSNSNLEGQGADYDGDQCSVRGLWTDEANREAEVIMNRKLSALTVTGSNIRVVSKEVYNSYYELTKIRINSKKVNAYDTDVYLKTPVGDYTRTFIADIVSDTADISHTKNTVKRQSRYNTWDTMIVPANYFYDGHGEFTTTLGRFIFNRYILHGSGVISETKFIDIEMGKSGLSFTDQLIGQLYMNDKINRAQFDDYTNRRDNLGYWLNGMLAHTISIRMAKPLPEIEKRKAELYKQYEKEIADKNIVIMNRIEKELVAYAREILKDDPGMDLYLSGDLDFANNYKNNSILKGPVLNKITNEFDFIETSFMNGINVKDIPAHANSIVSGAYPSAIATASAGYMGKQLLALLQMIEVDDPGTDCGTKRSIPITVSSRNKKELVDSYFIEGDQLKMLTSENVNGYVGKVLNFRSPMVCTNKKICSKCAGTLFYKLDTRYLGLLVSQLAYSDLNLNLKAKHVQTVNVGNLNLDTIIEDI